MRILITSDVHLGVERPESPVPLKNRMATLKKIFTIARDHDLLLIAGDFVHPGSGNGELFMALYQEMEALRSAGTDIVITPGPGELDDNGNVIDEIMDMPFTRVFSNRKLAHPFTGEKDSQKVFIYGVPAVQDADFYSLKRTETAGFHLGLVYARFDPAGLDDDGPIPLLSSNVIRKLDLDFYALGFSHNFRLFKVHNRIIGAYPGSPEALSWDETGDRYVISLTVKDDSISAMKRLSVNTLTLVRDEIDCGMFSESSLLKEEIIQRSSRKKICSLVLTGECDYQLGTDDLDDLKDHFFSLEIERKYRASINALVELYAEEHSLRGEFFRILNNRVKDGSIPGDVDRAVLTRILNQLVARGLGSVEDLL